MGNPSTRRRSRAEGADALAAPPAPELERLMARPVAPQPEQALPAVVLGELIALAADGRTPLVVFEARRAAGAVRARTVVDLHAAHVGKTVTLAFEGGDESRPIVMGVLRPDGGWPLQEPPAQVEVDAGGERMIVTAREQLVLRCGKASITLTRAGKVLIMGSYVSSRSSGVNRIRGGSVQLN